MNNTKPFTTSMGCPSNDGNRALYRTWKDQMQASFDFHDNLSDKKKIALILMALSTQAGKETSGRLAELRWKETGTEADAWKILDTRFDDPGHIDAAQTKLNALKQRGEAYEEYVQEFSNLLQEARGQEWPEEIKIDAFCRGLDRKILSHTLTTAPGNTLIEEMKIYRQVYTTNGITTWISSIQASADRLRTSRTKFNMVIQWILIPTTCTQTLLRDLVDNRALVQAYLMTNQYRGRVTKWVSKEEMDKRRQANVCLQCAHLQCHVRVCPLKPVRRPHHTQTQVNNSTVQEWVEPPVEEVSMEDEQGKV
ncbi:Retrotransposon gag protein [Ceratocystis lukuohia]|uniref:Retrotransposon gag protein n=1 Tax=Ceratocystis lukuohia TaxID=2019550 RepID=A0ABR4M8K2_9PEZI